MSMFQILTQEAWVEVMDETMWRTSETIVPVVAVYFILYHLFVTLVNLLTSLLIYFDSIDAFVYGAIVSFIYRLC